MEELKRSEIVMCYENLIQECKNNIKNNVDVEVNSQMMKEYKVILYEVKCKPNSHYKEIQNKINQIYELSMMIISMLKPIQPYKEY